jgi:hypothetical protein
MGSPMRRGLIAGLLAALSLASIPLASAQSLDGPDQHVRACATSPAASTTESARKLVREKASAIMAPWAC